MYRINKAAKDCILGTILVDNELDYEVNTLILKQRLNAADAFDMELRFKPKDVLKIMCHNNEEYKMVVYGFTHNGYCWRFYKISPFEIMKHYDRIVFGKMRN